MQSLYILRQVGHTRDP
jgi:hypothetical protein